MAPAAKQPAEQKIVQIPLDKIDPDPNNPRRTVTVDDDFVDSIRAHGILQAITVRPHPEKSGRYMICFGERRWTGAGLAPLKTVPCVVREDLDPGDVLETQLIENDARDGITPMDEARALVSLVQDHGRPQRDLAKRLGKSQSYLSKHMSLALRLPPAGQALLDSGGIKVHDAVLLASLHEHPDRVETVINAFRRSGPDDQTWNAGPAVLADHINGAKREKARSTALKKLEDTGVQIIDGNRPDWTGSVGLGAGAFGVELDPGKHAKEPCHRGWVDSDGNTSLWCADRARHAPTGDSKLKAPNLAPPPAPEPGDNPIKEFADKAEQVGAAGNNAAQADHEAAIARMEAERAEREKQREADQLLRNDVVGARRAFIRQLLTTTPDDPCAAGAGPDLTQLIDAYVMSSVDLVEGNHYPWVKLAADLLGFAPDTYLDGSLDHELTLLLEDYDAHFLITHPNQVAVALALTMSIPEKLVGTGLTAVAWTDKCFADLSVRRHFAYLQANGYQPAELETQLLAAGDAYRTVNLPHPFVSTGDNEAAGTCDVCGMNLAARATGSDGYRHTDAEERLAAIAEAEAADTDPVFAEFDAARKALDDPANKKGAAWKAAHAAFDDAKEQFAARLVDNLPDPAAAAEQLQTIHLAYAERLSTVGPIRGGQNYAEDSAAYQAFTDQMLEVLETGGPLPAVLRNAIKDRSEIRVGETPKTRAGTIKWVHVPDLVELLQAKAGDDTTAAFEFASTIPGYFDADDDEATNLVAKWVEDHNLDVHKLTDLLRVEQANAEAIDRPFLRAALVKLIAARIEARDLGVPADETPAEPAAEDDIPPGIVDLSGARLLGLTVMAFGAAREREVRESNATSAPGSITEPDKKLTVYWQTSKWLVDAGYAEKAADNVLTLTDTGRALADDHDVLADLVD